MPRVVDSYPLHTFSFLPLHKPLTQNRKKSAFDKMDLSTSQRDQVDWSSHAIAPLDFPTPNVSISSGPQKVFARDHRTGETHLIKVVMSSNRETERAYLLKQVLSVSHDRSEKTWAAVVLAPYSAPPTARGNDVDFVFDVNWQSTDEIFTVRVSSYKNLSALSRKRIIREISALQYVGTSNGHVQGCLETFKDEMNIYTVMPYCLEQKLPAFLPSVRNKSGTSFESKEEQARSMFKDLCEVCELVRPCLRSEKTYFSPDCLGSIGIDSFAEQGSISWEYLSRHSICC